MSDGIKATEVKTGSTGVGGGGNDRLKALGLAVIKRVGTACVGATSLQGAFRWAG